VRAQERHRTGKITLAGNAIDGADVATIRLFNYILTMESSLNSPVANDAATAATLDETAALKALAALAQTQRLRAFRALVVAGPDGLTPGAMADQLMVAPSALSFHLKELSYSGLVSSEARGRNLIYRANFAQMNGLLRYLTEHCCGGEACGTDALAACLACP
jgi:ArsR family transcriptional regulator, arsenate/arsenite/antimonite-responsive transcriptional repressor